MHVTEYALFPTRLLAIQFPDVDGLNAELYRLFTTGEQFRDGFDMHPDSLNLLQMAETCPPIARVREMYREGLKRWLRAERHTGKLTAEVTLFCNFAKQGEYTQVHNHSADVVGVYYVRVDAKDRPAIFVPEPEGEYDYFDAEDGALILHDPRFNANLAAGGGRDYAKVFPRPGLMLLFPAFLWHSVTPHLGAERRLALSANFTLRFDGARTGETWALDIDSRRIADA